MMESQEVQRLPDECTNPHTLHPAAMLLETCTLDADRQVMLVGWHETVVGGDSPIAQAFAPMTEIVTVEVQRHDGHVGVYRRPTR